MPRIDVKKFGPKLPGVDNDKQVENEIKDFLESLKTDITVGLASFFIGNATKGINDKGFIAGAKTNQVRSILGEKDSIYSLVHDIKEVFSEKNNKSIFNQTLTTLKEFKGIFEKYPDDIKDVIKEAIDLDKLEDLLEEHKEKNYEVDLIISGLSSDAIDSLIKLAEINTDDASNALRNLISVLKPLAEIDKKTIKGVAVLEKVLPRIVPLLEQFQNTWTQAASTNFDQNFNEIFKTFDNFNKLSQTIAGVKIDPKVEYSFEYIVGILKTTKDIMKYIGEKSTYLTSGNDILTSLASTTYPMIAKIVETIRNLSFDTKNAEIFNEIFKFIYESYNDLFLIFTDPKLKSVITEGVNTLEDIQNFFELFGIFSSYINEVETIEKQKEEDITNSIVFLNDSVIMNLITLSESVKEFTDHDGYNILDNINGQILDKLQSILKHIDEISKVDLSKTERIGDNIKNIEELINSLKRMKIDDSIKTTLEGLYNLFQPVEGEKKSLINKSLTQVFNSINNIQQPKTDKYQKIAEGIGSLGEILTILSEIGNLKDQSDKMKDNIVNYFTKLEEAYNAIEDKFKRSITIGAMADQSKLANQKIKEALEACNETAIDSSKNTKEVRQANINMEGMASFMFAAAVVMSIGALFIMAGGGKFVKAALAFGVTLAIFEALVLAPILIIKNVKSQVLEGLQDFSGFLVTCTAIMLIGALFMGLAGGKLVKNALLFGVTLGIFEALVLAPILIIKSVKGEVLEGLRDFSVFMITCTTIMLIGALFMGLAGGKLVKNALLFGLTLALFEALVLAPILLFSKMKGEVLEGLRDFSKFLITCTTVMLIGALFMALGGGKFAVHALAFGLLLAAFEVLVIAPFLLMNLIKNEVFDGMKSFNTTVITCTVILLIGSLFMLLGGGKFVKAALKFTLLLMAFEVGVIAPFLLFNLIKGEAMSSLKDFSLFLIVCTTCLLVGALFMRIKWMPINALKFTGILSLFIAAISAVVVGMSIWLNGRAMMSMKELSIFIGISTLCLTMGAFFIKKFGVKPVKEYAWILGIFVTAMGVVAAGLSWIINPVTSTALTEFSIFVGVLHAIILTGALFVKKFGTESVVLYASVFFGFTAAMGKVASNIVDTFDDTSLESMRDFSLFVGVLHAIILTGALFVKKFGTEDILTYGLVFSGFVETMGKVMSHITKMMGGREIQSLREFDIFVAVLHGIITTGSFFVHEFGIKSVEQYGLVFSVFTEIMGGVVWSISKMMNGKTVPSLKEFEIFVGVLHGIILTGALFVNYIGAKPVLEYGTLMSGFTEVMSLIVWQVSSTMKKIDKESIIGYCIFIGELHAIMLTGAMYIDNYGEAGAMTYAMLISGFTEIMSLIVWQLSSTMKKIDKASLLSFCAFIGSLHIILMTGTYFVQQFGTDGAMSYALLLGGFTTEMGLIFAFLSKKQKEIEKGAIAGMAMSGGILTLGTVIAFVVALFRDYPFDEIMADIVSLGLAAGEFGGIFYLIGKKKKEVAIGSAVMLAISAAMGIFGTVLGIVVGIFAKYNFTEIMSCLGYLGLAAIEFATLFGILGGAGASIPGIGQALAPLLAGLPLFVSLGSAVAAAMGLGIGIFGTALGAVVGIFAQYKWTEILSCFGYLGLATIEFGTLFTGIGALGILIYPGTLILESMGNALRIYGMSLHLVVDIFKKNGYTAEDISLAITRIKESSNQLESFFRGLSFSPLINSGTGTVRLMGASLYQFGQALNIIYDGHKKYGDEILDDIKLYQDAVNDGIAPLYKSVSDLPVATVILKTLGMKLISDDLFEVIKDINKGIKEINKIDNIEESIETITTNISKYFDIPAQVELGGIWGWAKTKLKLMALKGLSDDIAQVLGDVGEGVYSIASLQVPSKYNENGKVVGYRQLRDRDFDLAADNTMKVLITMSMALVEVYNTLNESGLLTAGSTIKEFLGISESPLTKVLNISLTIGKVMSNIGEAIGNIAKMQIPTQYNDEGKPISFRQLKEKDFEMARKGVSKVLTGLVTALYEMYQDGANWPGTNGKNVFDMGSEGFLGIGAEASPIEKVLGVSFQIGELVANIGEGIGKIAKLQIPIAWDPKTGKVTNYRTLKEKDFQDMTKGVSTVLTSILEALCSIGSGKYKKMFEQTRSGLLGAITGKKDPSPIELVIGSALKISQMVGNIGTGISKIASLQIPNRWDPKTGVAISYARLEKEDLIEAGVVVGEVISCIVKALNDMYWSNPIMWKGDTLKNIIDAVLPIADLVSNMATGITKLASGQIPDEWDPKTGKPIHFTSIKPEDYVAAGETIGMITTSIAESLLQIVKDNPQYFFTLDENGDPIFDESNDAFQTVVQSFTGITGILNGMTDSIIKLGQGLVADKWDDSGKPIHYKPIEFDKVIPQMQNIIEKILTSIAETAITIYNNHKGDAFAENSTFSEAVQAMNGTVEMMSKMTDTIIKIGSSMIPDRWDDKGKPIHFTKVNVDEAVAKANDIFSQIMGGMILTISQLIHGQLRYTDKNGTTWILPNPTTQWWQERLNDVTDVITKVTGVIGTAADKVIDIASLKIPTSFDGEGKAKGYVKLEIKDIQKARDNMIEILTSFVSILEEEKIKEMYITNYKDTLDNATKMAESIDEVTSTIGTIIQDVTSLLDYENDLKKIYQYSKSSLDKAAGVNIGFFIDIYGLVSNVGKIIQAITGSFKSESGTQQSILDSLQLNPKVKALLDKNQIQKDLQNILGIISDILNTVSNFDESLFSSKNISGFMQKTPEGEYVIVQLVNNIMKIYESILSTFNKPSDKDKYGLMFMESSSTSKLNDYVDTIIETNKGILKLVSMASLLNSIPSMTFDKSKITDIENLKIFYGTIFDSLANLTVSDSKKQSLFKNFADVTEVTKCVSSIFNNMISVYQLYYDNLDKFQSTITGIVEQLEKSEDATSESIKKLQENITNINTLYDSINVNKDDKGHTDLYFITNDINRFITVIALFKADVHSNSDNLVKSVKNIYEATSNQKQSKIFSENSKVLANYIRSINSVNVNSTNALTQLVKELNLLGTRLGNIDRLTDALANKLAVVLQHLVEKLEESKEAIDKADVIQKERHELIDKSVKEVQDMLNKSLTVTIKTEGPDMTPPV